jgi:NAD(P)-dependent dehydrogenase (short-subunit alcohol dehydrogenase family)
VTEKRCFVIYGAASDVIRPVFSSYPNDEFICLINIDRPAHLKGEILATGEADFKHRLKAKLKEIPPDRMLVFINAAVYTDDCLFSGHTLENLERMISVGVSQISEISQILVAEMLSRRKGRLINISSFRARNPAKGTVMYSAIKSFSETLFKGIALELGRFDITSNSIALGFMDTKLLAGLPESSVEKFKRAVSKRKFLNEDEFIGTLNYVLQSTYLNGATVDLDGALLMVEG